MHDSFMIVLSALFVVVFAIMIHSMVKHRRAPGNPAAKFSGPTGTVQWLWALVPFGILAFVNITLISVPKERISTNTPQKTIAIAPNLNPDLSVSVQNALAMATAGDNDKSLSTNAH